MSRWTYLAGMVRARWSRLHDYLAEIDRPTRIVLSAAAAWIVLFLVGALIVGPAALGALGDWFGVVAAVGAGLAAIFAARALALQHDEIRRYGEEVDALRHEHARAARRPLAHAWLGTWFGGDYPSQARRLACSFPAKLPTKRTGGLGDVEANVVMARDAILALLDRLDQARFLYDHDLADQLTLRAAVLESEDSIGRILAAVEITRLANSSDFAAAPRVAQFVASLRAEPDRAREAASSDVEAHE